MKGQILPTKVLVKEAEKETKTEKGILIPQTTKTPTIKGTVVMVGAGTDDAPMIVKEGMNVLFPPRSAQIFELEKVEYLLLDQGSILFMY